MGTYKGLFLLLGACALVALMAWRGQERVFIDHGRLDIRQDGDAIVLSWRSSVTPPMARRFEEAFYELADKTDRFVIDLNSPGGSLGEGADVVDLIEDMKRTHRVDTHVGRGRACLSMCVPIFLQGEARRAAGSSRWMFHEPSTHDAVTGEEVRIPQFEQRYVAERFVDRYFAASDIDPDWLAGLESEWRGRDVWRSGRQLYDEGSNIILEVY